MPIATKKNTCTTIISTDMISYVNPSVLLTLRELYVVHNNISDDDIITKSLSMIL